MRETGRHAETSAALLRGILGAVMVMLLILGGGLYLWKTCGKKKNKESEMWRQVALIPSVPDPCPPHWIQSPSLLHLATQAIALQRE